MQPTLICWNLPAADAGKARFLCMRLGIRLAEMPASLCSLPIREALSSLPLPAEEASLPFREPMLLMCGFSSAQFHSLLDRWKEQGLKPVPLKAVLTEDNRRWTSLRLYEELSGEAAALGAQSP